MITVNIETNIYRNIHIIKMSYNGINVMFTCPLGNNCVMSELDIRNLFNLFAETLKDFKKEALQKYEADKDKVKFIGINYD